MTQKLTQTYLTSFGFSIWTEYSGTGPPSAFKKAGNIFAILFALGVVGALVYLFVTRQRRTKSFLDMADVQSAWLSIVNRIETIRQNSPSAPPMPPTEGFVRFDNQNEIELNAENQASAPSVEVSQVSFKDLQRRCSESGQQEQVEAEPESSKGFANPLYNSELGVLEHLRKMATENIYTKEPSASAPIEKSHENPLYDLMVDISAEAEKPQDKAEETKQKEGMLVLICKAMISFDLNTYSRRCYLLRNPCGRGETYRGRT